MAVVDPVVVARVVEGAVLAPGAVRPPVAAAVPVPWAGVESLLLSKRPPSNWPAWATARTRWSTRRPFWAVSNRGSAIHPRTTKCRVCPVCPMRDVRLRLCPFAWACVVLFFFFFRFSFLFLSLFLFSFFLFFFFFCYGLRYSDCFFFLVNRIGVFLFCILFFFFFFFFFFLLFFFVVDGRVRFFCTFLNGREVNLREILLSR